jgi:hypothetical protein
VSRIKSSGNLQSIIIGSNFSNFSGVFDFIIIQYGTAVKINEISLGTDGDTVVGTPRAYHDLPVL